MTVLYSLSRHDDVFLVEHFGAKQAPHLNVGFAFLTPKSCGSRTCKPNFVCWMNPAGRSFLWAAHYCEALATYPEVVTHRAGTCSGTNPELPPYLVLLRVGFALPAALLPRRCALTAPFHPYPAVVLSPLAHGHLRSHGCSEMDGLTTTTGRYVFCGTFRQSGLNPISRTLSGTLLCGVRTFLPAHSRNLVESHASWEPHTKEVARMGGATVRSGCQPIHYMR